MFFYGYHENSLYLCFLAFVYFGRHYIFAYCFAYQYLLFTGTTGQEKLSKLILFTYVYDSQKLGICLISILDNIICFTLYVSLLLFCLFKHSICLQIQQFLKQCESLYSFHCLQKLAICIYVSIILNVLFIGLAKD